jgi:V/A-type H+-transporting ATPase subunit D
MSGQQMAATRINLVRARRDMARVLKGATLVRRKREAFVAELFRAARPAVESRSRIHTAARAAAESLVEALGVHGASALEQMSWPRRQVEIEVQPARVWGVPVSDVVTQPRMARTVESRAVAPGTAGPAATLAASRYEELADLLIEAAPHEQRVRRLSEAVARASRQLRTLEQHLAPRIARQIAVVRRQLDEREREERLRLKHVQRRHATFRRST